MSRDHHPHLAARGLLVWSAVAVATLAAGATLAPTWEPLLAQGGRADFADLLVAACAAGLVLALTWLWVVTTVTVAEVLTGRVRADGGATRRLVLAACGVAVLAGTAGPAVAADDAGPALAGLSLPDRTTASAAVHDPERARQTKDESGAPGTRGTPDDRGATSPISHRQNDQAARHVVRPGDSLWSIAAADTAAASTGGLESSVAEVDRRWRAIWAANRDLVGDDPDLIRPGQRLRVPGSGTTTEKPTDEKPTDEDEGAR